MAIEWIKANLALQYASFGDDEYSIRQRIIQRANAGLIAAKADKLFWDGAEHRNKRIPPAFWRTDALDDDLDENWEQGDFERRSRFEVEEQALGVSFDFVAISELVPPHRQADAMRQISLSSNQDWISARKLREMMFAIHNPMRTGAAIIEACQLGHIAGRSERMTGKSSTGASKLDPSSKHSAMAWDVPLWFWRDFIDDGNAQEWSLSKLRGHGRRDGRWIEIALQGLHFHRSGLANLELETETTPSKEILKVGRKPTYDWPAACLAIFGEIHRGNLKPEFQADVERALILHLSDGDNGPSESTVRPYAKQIWAEANKA